MSHAAFTADEMSNVLGAAILHLNEASAKNAKLLGSRIGDAGLIVAKHEGSAAGPLDGVQSFVGTGNQQSVKTMKKTASYHKGRGAKAKSTKRKRQADKK